MRSCFYVCIDLIFHLAYLTYYYFSARLFLICYLDLVNIFCGLYHKLSVNAESATFLSTLQFLYFVFQIFLVCTVSNFWFL